MSRASITEIRNMLSDNTTKVAVELHRLNKSAWFSLGSTAAVVEFAKQVGFGVREFRAAIDELDQYGLIRVDKGMNTPGVPMELRDVAGIEIYPALQGRLAQLDLLVE